MIPEKHPRRVSLEVRHKLVDGFKKGLVAQAGLIAQGRGEAFDYLVGEKTSVIARKAEEAAVALMLLAENPVISVNGNAAALCPGEIARLASLVKAKVEVNLFYRSVEREKKIANVLKKAGVKKVYGVASKPKKIAGLQSNRRMIDEALWNSDVVLVPLEDGDRTEALVKMGK
ncbi:MAG: phosphopantothenate/pantothenate synthetase, partial [Candidatus Altiarchaeales archaeon]|nr:phosphopantothenate/pantothenate synthetase [Candidatus Altiarchaeales archaeon]